jgi:hypothetical protein
MTDRLRAAILLGVRMEDAEAENMLAQKAKQAKDIERCQQGLGDVRRETRNLIVMQMGPGQSPEMLKFLHDLERSCRAETKLRVCWLAHVNATTYLKDGGGSIT